MQGETNRSMEPMRAWKTDLNLYETLWYDQGDVKIKWKNEVFNKCFVGKYLCITICTKIYSSYHKTLNAIEILIQRNQYDNNI